MNRQSHIPSAMLTTALSASGFVGTWEHDLATGNVVLDAGASKILLGDQDFGGHSISLCKTLSCLHPGDRDWVRPAIDQFAELGGDFSAEYKVLTAQGKPHRLLDLGHTVNQADGSKHGFGVLIDITDRDIQFAQSAQTARLLTEKNILDALANLENRALGSSSFRTRVLLSMLRLEIERTGT